MIDAVFRPSRPFPYPGAELRLYRPQRPLSGPHPDESTQKALEIARLRALIIGGLFVLAFLSVGARLIDVMILKADDGPMTIQRSPVSPFSVKRADIVDRNGILLATNLPTVNLYADALKIVDAQEAADKLTAVLPSLNRVETLKKLQSGRRFIYLSRNLTPREQAAINAQGIPGVYFEDSERRTYIHGSLASHILGAADLDHTGIAGIERSLDKELKSEKNLRLSLDIRVQYVVHEAMARNVAHFHAKAGAAIVMDVRSGEVLSMVSLPDFDPDRFGSATEEERFNRVTLGVYEMGSAFKLLNTAMALDAGAVKLNDVFDTATPLKIAQFTLRDMKPAKRPLSVAEILISSSNVGSAKIADRVGPKRQQAFLSSVGMLHPVQLQFKELGTPLLPKPWREINTMTIAYGHGIAVTPMHVASAISALVNGGVFRQPTLLADALAPPSRVLTPETSAIMRQLMRRVVIEGTGKKADVPGYMVGAKTGTAEKVAAKGGYDKKSNIAVSTAIFPADRPEYLVLVMLDEPQALKSTYGFAMAGWNAAPTAGEIIAGIAPLLGVQPRPLDAVPSGLPLPEDEAGAILVDWKSPLASKTQFVSLRTME